VFRVFDIYIDDMYKYDIYIYIFLYCWIGFKKVSHDFCMS
jgi:hypothetical protein